MHGRATALVATALATAACSGADAGTTDPAEAAVDATADPTTAEPTADAPAGEVIEVTGVDYAFEGLPSEIAAGSTVTFTNASDVEAHEIVLFRLPDGEDRPVEELLETFEPEGEPALVSVAGPGQDGEVFVGDGTITEPGRYIAVCFLPVGGDPEQVLGDEAPTEEAGPPHAFEGMVAEVQVS